MAQRTSREAISKSPMEVVDALLEREVRALTRAVPKARRTLIEGMSSPGVTKENLQAANNVLYHGRGLLALLLKYRPAHPETPMSENQRLLAEYQRRILQPSAFDGEEEEARDPTGGSRSGRFQRARVFRRPNVPAR